MKTRFDETKTWVTGNGEVLLITDMETTHLMNVVRVFAQKPYISMGMLVKDIERTSVYCPIGEVWTPIRCNENNVKKQSISNITSMNETEIIAYTMNSPLCQSMLDELNSRGVNVENFLEMILNNNNEMGAMSDGN